MRTKQRATDRQTPIGNLLYSLRPRFFDRDQARRAPPGLGASRNDQGQGDMVGRRSATAVSILGRATLFACRGAGVRANLSLSLLRRLSGSRRRIRRHAGTRPSGAQAENRPCGPTVSTATRRSLRFSACPALSPVCFLGPATAAPKGMERWGRASLPPTMMDPVLVGPGFFVGRATARHLDAPAHQRGSEFRQENNAIDQI